MFANKNSHLYELSSSLATVFFFPAVLNSLGVIRITFNFRFVLYPHSFSKDMLTAQQARRKDKITGRRRANLPSKLPLPPPPPPPPPPVKNRQIREPKQRRRRRQRERQKRNVLSKQNNNYAFWYISLKFLHDCDVYCPIKIHVLWTRRQIFLCPFKLGPVL